MSNIFIYKGQTFEIVDASPDFKQVSIGMWLRLSYDPSASKPDEIGQVISIEPSPVGWQDDYRIVLAQDGDPHNRRDLRSHDGHFEILRKKGQEN